METLWVMVVTISGLIQPAASTTVEERKGFEFVQITNISEMHFVSEEACNAARGAMIQGKSQLTRGLENPTLSITPCKAAEFKIN